MEDKTEWSDSSSQTERLRQNDGALPRQAEGSACEKTRRGIGLLA